jgi:hypothetical protein
VRFLLGTHRPNWLEELTVPLFISHRRLKGYKTLPHACGEWALDSGGFTELSKYGEWRTTVPEYLEAVTRYQAEVGNLAWAAPQDWMCEPWIIAKTGLSVREHQERTVTNYLDLRDRGPFIPVLQGWDARGLRLHGFGMKSRGVARVGHLLASADSLAWSSRARNEWHHERRRLCGGEHRGGCANCLPWALRWRQRVVDGLGLFAEVAA